MVVMWGEKIIRHTTQHIQNFNQIHGNVNDKLTKENGMRQNYFVVDFRTKEIFEYLTEEKAIRLCENNPHRIFKQY